MPWKVSDVMKQRAGFVEEFASEDWSMAELCREYGITRKTGYKWVNRYEVGGPGELGDQPRAPRRHPNETNAEMEEEILRLRTEHRGGGARKIAERLKRQPAEG